MLTIAQWLGTVTGSLLVWATVTADQVGVHDPAVPLAQPGAGGSDFVRDVRQRPGDQHLVRRTEVGAPVDRQTGLVEPGGGKPAVQHDHDTVQAVGQPWFGELSEPSRRGDVDRVAGPRPPGPEARGRGPQ